MSLINKNNHLYTSLIAFSLFVSACDDNSSSKQLIQDIPIELETVHTKVNVEQNKASQTWYELKNTPSKLVTKNGKQFLSIQNPSYGKEIPSKLVSTVYSSNDGLTWVPVNTQLKGEFRSIKYINNWYYAVGHGHTNYGRPLIQRSQDGINWQLVLSNDAISSKLINIDYSDGQYTATGSQGNIFTSKDGIKWQNKKLPSNISFEVNGSLKQQPLLLDLLPLSLYQIKTNANSVALRKINIHVTPNPSDYTPNKSPTNLSVNSTEIKSEATAQNRHEPIGFYPAGLIENKQVSILQIMNRLYFLNNSGDWSVAEFPKTFIQKNNRDHTIYHESKTDKLILISSNNQVLSSEDGRNWQTIGFIDQTNPTNGLSCATADCVVINGKIYLPTNKP